MKDNKYYFKVFPLLLMMIIFSSVSAQKYYFYNNDLSINVEIMNDSLHIELQNMYYDKKNIYFSNSMCGLASYKNNNIFTFKYGFDYRCFVEGYVEFVLLRPQEKIGFSHFVDNSIEELFLNIGYIYLPSEINYSTNIDMKSNKREKYEYKYLNYHMPLCR